MANTIGDESAQKVHGLLADLHHKMQKGSITVVHVERFLNKQNPFGSIITDKDDVLRVTVNRDRSIADGVTDGKYNSSNPDINDTYFPRSRAGIESSEIVLVHFDKSMSTDNVLKELEERNLRPADVQELLAIGEQYPDKQREFPIIALGSIRQRLVGRRVVPYLHALGSNRELYLDWIGRDWEGFYRFAAVRK